MSAIPDIITVIGASYYQPIADLIDRLAIISSRRDGDSTPSHEENGYAVACVVLLAALLESFTSRVRFKRRSEIQGTPSVPDLLLGLFPHLPTRDGIHEVFLLRNIVVHNHLWHLDLSDATADDASTIAAPRELGFSVNKNYDALVDLTTRRTVHLKLSAVPTWVGFEDVRSVFETVWRTLEHMNSASFDHTPLAGRRVRFRGALRDFELLLQEDVVPKGAA